MGKYDIKALFRKLTQGTISSEELAFLNKWMEANKEEGLSDIMDKDWASFAQTTPIQGSPRWKNSHPSNPILFLYRRWAVAAALLLLLVTGALYIGGFMGRTPQLVQLINNDLRKQMIELPDGSTVWLKRNSKISYWKPFRPDGRIIELEGEAFFEVYTDSTQPFIVQAPYLTTKVLGTSFNVISGNEFSIPEVALKEGAVEVSYVLDNKTVKPFLLQPGKKFQLNPENQEVITSTYEEKDPYAWKEDVLVFSKANIYQVARILEDWYDIEFIVEAQNIGPTGLVHRYDTKKYGLAQVLKGISKVMPYSFHYQEDGSYIIKPKRIE